MDDVTTILMHVRSLHAAFRNEAGHLNGQDLARQRRRDKFDEFDDDGY